MTTAPTESGETADLADQLAQLDDAALLATVNRALATREPKADEQTDGEQPDSDRYEAYYPGSKR